MPVCRPTRYILPHIENRGDYLGRAWLFRSVVERPAQAVRASLSLVCNLLKRFRFMMTISRTSDKIEL
jgi:hypothetical protein